MSGMRPSDAQYKAVGRPGDCGAASDCSPSALRIGMTATRKRKGDERRRSRRAAGGPLSFADSADPGLPPPQGLYDPALDKDACGVGFIADIKGRKSHKIVEDALSIVCNLEHRGAVGADPRAGDG